VVQIFIAIQTIILIILYFIGLFFRANAIILRGFLYEKITYANDSHITFGRLHRIHWPSDDKDKYNVYHSDREQHNSNACDNRNDCH
jgi:hypothetical protein